jgi:hypothetical protein
MNRPKISEGTRYSLEFGGACIASLVLAAICIDIQTSGWIRDGLLLLAGVSFILSALFAVAGN